MKPVEKPFSQACEENKIPIRDLLLLYLAENGAADELRENSEAMSRFFGTDGELKVELLEKLRLDIGELVHPSQQRAMRLNKAYRVIALEQGFWKGRDATITPAVNVHREVLQGQATGIAKPVF